MNQGKRPFRRSLIATGLIVAGGLSMMFQAPSDSRPSSAEITPTAELSSTLAKAASPVSVTKDAKRAIAETLGQRPLGFERNQGQFDAATRFAARGANYGI